MKLVCLSDTHGRHRELTLPPGDILLHAGDFTRKGRAEEIADFNHWLAGLAYQHKLVIAGNHDFLFEDDPEQARALLSAAHYLEDSGLELEGLKFWGSPVSPRFFDWAFNRSRGAEIAAHWAKIPGDTDILLVHSPPQGYQDRTWLGQHVGCEMLEQELSGRLNPLLLVCGHIHESAGYSYLEQSCILNASSLDRHYRPVQPVWVLELEPESRKLMSISKA